MPQNPTPDTATEIYAAIRDALETDPQWSAKVSPGNRVWHNLVPGTDNPDRAPTSDVDYPRSNLRLVGGSNSLFENDVTFETYSESGPHTWVEKQTYNFTLQVISRLLSIEETDSLGLESINAIRRLGPRLGLSYVTKISLGWSVSDSFSRSDDTPDSIKRERMVLRILVNAEPQGQNLTGD